MAYKNNSLEAILAMEKCRTDNYGADYYDEEETCYSRDGWDDVDDAYDDWRDER